MSADSQWFALSRWSCDLLCPASHATQPNFNQMEWTHTHTNPTPKPTHHSLTHTH